jgi:hypothetical protein
MVLLGVVGVIAAVGIVGWLIGSVAGAIFAGGWPDLGLADGATAAFSLREHLGSPRDAWPENVRERLPGASGMYVSSVLVLSCLGALVWMTASRWCGRNHGPANARWATTASWRHCSPRIRRDRV